jgi:hypothetical protein
MAATGNIPPVTTPVPRLSLTMISIIYPEEKAYRVLQVLLRLL